jgi:hypothetical protein
MVSRLSAAGAALVAVALAGCGGASTNGSAPSAEQKQAALNSLRNRLLMAGELPGFVPQGTRQVGANASSWISSVGLTRREARKEIARLERAGFRAGMRERLAPVSGGSAEAISLVEQFNSKAAAKAELLKQAEGLHARGARLLPLASIPGGVGIAISTTERAGANVEFADGPYYYVVGAGWGPHEPHAPKAVAVTAAAHALYKRVHH